MIITVLLSIAFALFIHGTVLGSRISTNRGFVDQSLFTMSKAIKFNKSNCYWLSDIFSRNAKDTAMQKRALIKNSTL